MNHKNIVFIKVVNRSYRTIASFARYSTTSNLMSQNIFDNQHPARGLGGGGGGSRHFIAPDVGEKLTHVAWERTESTARVHQLLHTTEQWDFTLFTQCGPRTLGQKTREKLIILEKFNQAIM